MMKTVTLLRTCLVGIALGLCAGSVCAQSEQRTKLNLSLWKGLSTQHSDTTGVTGFNLGIYSWTNRLKGVSINLLGSTTRRNANGLQLSGLFNTTGGAVHGFQAAGITNSNGLGLTGISLAGLVGINGNDSRGLMLAGLANISGNQTQGFAAGGVINFIGGNSTGLFLSGLGTINGGSMKGGVAGGLVTVVCQDLQGVQLSGIANIVGEELRGVQLSPFNVAVRGKGVQIGLVNYYRESFDGVQLGLVNANPRTRVQLLLFGGNRTKLNLGFRFTNDLFYTLLGGGTHYLDLGNKLSAAFFYRAGLRMRLGQAWYLSGDLGYQHIETFRNRHNGFPARLYALQARLNIEYMFTERWGLFASGGYGLTRHYDKNKTFDKGVIAEGGLIVTLNP